MKNSQPPKELPLSLQLDNAFMACGWPMALIFYPQMWFASLYDKRRRKWRLTPPPHVMEVVSDSVAPVEYRNHLHDRGVSTAGLMLQWELVGGVICQRHTWIVPGHLRTFAEDIHNRNMEDDPIPAKGPTVKSSNLDMWLSGAMHGLTERHRSALGKKVK
jgi:hypothetical protein